jgi:hypothetical protein
LQRVEINVISLFLIYLIVFMSQEKIEPTQDYIVTEERPALVREEYRKADENPGYALDWGHSKRSV